MRGMLSWKFPKERTGQSWSFHTAEEVQAAKDSLASLELSVFMGTPEDEAVKYAAHRLMLKPTV